MAAALKGKPTLLHTDAIQGFLKVPFTAASLGADLIALSGHKVGGPKGIGALYIGGKMKNPRPLLYGGGHRDDPDSDSGWIAPTLVADTLEGTSKPMGEEIFGPILPIIPYDTLDQAIDFIRQREKPLALYLFTQSRKTKERILNTCSFGGGCVNDTIIHLATHHMPFGGVGQSGMGSYHGKKSFETFSHYRSIVDKATWLDLPMRYQPYTKLNNLLVRMFIH